MSSILLLPGWVIGSVATAAILIVGVPPLLHAARLQRRISGLAITRHRTPATTMPGGGTRAGPLRRFTPVTPATAVKPVNPVSPVRPVTPATAVKPVKPARPVRPVSPVRLVGLAALAVAAAAVSPPLTVAALAAAWVWPRWRSASARRRHDRAVLAELPEVVDLLQVAVASGLNLRLSVAALGERGPPLFGAALERAATDIAAGARVADALDTALAGLGAPARPLAIALLGSARYGTSLTATLDRLAIETRQLRRRQAEEAIRRVPVKLLFPLVLLVLPAFVLLTVVPLLASALRSLPF
jgi:tight adherence protein C